ncbi:hypothetical protein LTR27_000618 [Elasticomyces elasticus]|nr:hypothetical protein LTR27_000618 [Elasticomyces elasticus]
MQRRTTARATTRKKYTVDAFEGVPELEEADSEGGELLDEEESENHDLQSVPKVPRKPRDTPGNRSVEEARRKWANDLTLPSRCEKADDLGGLHNSLHQDDKARQDANENWLWYTNGGGKEAFESRQQLTSLTDVEVEGYRSPDAAIHFVMGPYTDQKLFGLAVGQSVPLADAWMRPASNVPDSVQHSRPGFMLNLGTVRCLEWVPGQRGDIQYLTTTAGKEPDTKAEPEGTSGPSKPTGQSSICIWSFQADDAGYVDTTIRPELEMVLCTAWDAITSLKWCPVPCPEPTTFGLLAFIAEDGALRVLDVPLSSRDATHMLVRRVLFESRPNGTFCLCVAWICPTRLAAGCADGTLLIFDLEEASSAAEYQGLSIPVSTSQITSLTSCAPSHPHMLLASSADGSLDIVDTGNVSSLVTPLTGVPFPSMLSRPLLLWHDYSQRPFTTDDNCEVFARQLRKGSHKVAVSKARSIITAIAGSPHHPCLLTGTAGGEVHVTNPIIKAVNPKADMWQQTWFVHAWRRPTAEEKDVADDDAMAVDDESASNVGRTGLSRFLEGFKPERFRPDVRGEVSVTAGSSPYVIYEEKTAVTALAWNPNVQCAGWAAAAMADGLVRVEDIAV